MPAPATRKRNPRKPAPPVVRTIPPAPAADPFDDTPSSPYAVYCGPYKDFQWAACIVWQRNEFSVEVIMLEPTVHTTALSLDRFARFRPMAVPADCILETEYPVARAVEHFLRTHRPTTPQALRILRNIKAGKPPEDGPLPVTLAPEVDPFDETPSTSRPAATRPRQRLQRVAATTEERRAKKRARRKARLAKLSPKDLQAWKTKRKARRAELRELKKGRQA
jgi:hypothetical protein